MPKSQMNHRRNARVLDARAGLIPASDAIEDELDARVARVGRAVSIYAKRTGGRDELAIVDILHGLRHYCDRRALALTNSTGQPTEIT
jgi:hypothetical protein